MRRIVTVFLSTVTVLVLLFSYRTSTDSSAATASVVSRAAGTRPGSASAVPVPSSSPPATSGGSSGNGASGSSGTSGTFTGEVADTRWGPVQVQVTVRNGRITAADAVQVPSDNPRDAEINGYAVPVLNQEVVQAQGASIDTVSGATVTSDGYLQSLQSALDQAHL
jgi:uncharacterized protein with FMN-binding domain